MVQGTGQRRFGRAAAAPAAVVLGSSESVAVAPQARPHHHHSERRGTTREAQPTQTSPLDTVNSRVAVRLVPRQSFNASE